MKSFSMLCALTLTGVMACAGTACADNYPQRCGTLRIIVPYGAGGPNDTMARVFAEGLKNIFQIPVIVENRAGVAGTRAPAEFALAALRRKQDNQPADECSLVHMGDTPFDPRVGVYYGYGKDAFLPVALTGMYYPMWIVASAKPFEVSGAAPIRIGNVRELVAYSKEHPSTLNYTGAGSTSAFCGQEFVKDLGVKMINVLYRSEKEGLTDIIAGRTHISCAFQLNTRELVKAKQLNVLATTAIMRDPNFPGVPTVRELGNELQIDALRHFPRFDIWGMIVADPGMTTAHRKVLADAMCRISEETKTRETFKNMTLAPAPCGIEFAKKAAQIAYDTLGVRPDPISGK